MDGPAPAALLCVAFGLALGFAGWRGMIAGLAALAVAGSLGAAAPWPADWRDPSVLAGWATVLLLAASVHVKGRRGVLMTVVAGAVVGLLASAQSVSGGCRADLLVAVPAALLAVPARLMVARGWGLAIKVAASWLIAVAVLAAALSTVPTPGYAPDHME